MSLDLAYVELTVIKDLRLRAGKIRNPLGLYTDIYKVGTLRPFYLLPNSYYRLAPESYVGLGVNRVQRFGSVGAGAGRCSAARWTSRPRRRHDRRLRPRRRMTSVRLRARRGDGQGRDRRRLLLRTPIEGLKVGLSAYTMRLYGSVAGAPLTR